ncbi:MAG: plasmid pRiA4b ORF-3 family protein, partial [Deltaproteobacteria bacterium]
EYDFGDSWMHRIKVEKILGQESSAGDAVKCIDGARACPPEDCGGVWGYEDMLQVLKDPKHEEYESALEWLGGDFDPEGFDMEATNKALRQF